MHNLSLTSVSIAVLVWLTLAAGPARADLAPPDQCTSPGQPCQNAGAGHDQAGTCTPTTCTKSVATGDGGVMTMTYDCNLCRLPSDAGAGGDASDAGKSKGSSSGCAVAGGVEGGTTAAAAAAALALLAASIVARRRPRA